MIIIQKINANSFKIAINNNAYNKQSYQTKVLLNKHTINQKNKIELKIGKIKKKDLSKGSKE